MKVAYSCGEHEVNPGDRFKLYDGAEFEVVRVSGRGMYSPSGLGGTATFACKQLSGQRYPSNYYDTEDLIDMCGDSIACQLAIADGTHPAVKSSAETVSGQSNV